jgi:predicted DNA-binding protein (UPF0251 family)
MNINVFYGHMLGDGSIESGKNRFSLGQKEANKEWVEHAYEALHPYTEGKKISFVKDFKNGKQFKKKVYCSYRFRTCLDPFFEKERLHWYESNLPFAQKIVPKELILNWELVATWYADDGCNWQSGKWIILATQSFTKNDVLFLMTRLKSDLGIESSITKRGEHQFMIRIPTASYYQFIAGVSPFLPQKCFDYKIDTSIAKTHLLKHEVVFDDATKEKAKLLRDNGLTNIEIAKKLKTDRKTIQRWLGNKNKSSIVLVEKNKKAIQLWQTKKYSKAAIAAIIGVHRKTVCRWLR